jgi:hypothetical protein
MKIDPVEIESTESFWHLFQKIVVVIIILTLPLILFQDFIINLFTN